MQVNNDKGYILSLVEELNRLDDKVDRMENKVDKMSDKIGKIEVIEERQKDFKEFSEKLSGQMEKLTETIGLLSSTISNIKGRSDGGWKIWGSLAALIFAIAVGGGSAIINMYADISVIKSKAVK